MKKVNWRFDDLGTHLPGRVSLRSHQSISAGAEVSCSIWRVDSLTHRLLLLMQAYDDMFLTATTSHD
jgi:hypothetical protein